MARLVAVVVVAVAIAIVVVVVALLVLALVRPPRLSGKWACQGASSNLCLQGMGSALKSFLGARDIQTEKAERNERRCNQDFHLLGINDSLKNRNYRFSF